MEIRVLAPEVKREEGSDDYFEVLRLTGWILDCHKVPHVAAENFPAESARRAHVHIE